MSGRPANFFRHLADPATDRELLARFAATRDEAAFAELVRRHGPVVLAACRRGTRGHHDADDAYQVVFLVLARRAGEVGQPELLGNWLYRVAVRVARDVRRAAARRRVHEVQGAEGPEPSVGPSEPASDLGPVLDEELGRLASYYREAVVLCDLRGVSRADAAAALGVPAGTLASRLDAGRRKLAARLTHRGITPSVALTAAGAVSVPANLSAKACRLASDWADGGAIPPAFLHLVQGGITMRKAVLVGVTSLVATVVVGFGLSARPQGGASPPLPPPRAAVKGADPAGQVKEGRAPAERLAPQGQPVVVALPHGRVEVLYYESEWGMRIMVKTGAAEVQGRRVHIGDGKVAVAFEADGKGWDGPDGRVNRAGVDYPAGATVRVPADRAKKWAAVAGEIYVLTPELTYQVAK